MNIIGRMHVGKRGKTWRIISKIDTGCVILQRCDRKSRLKIKLIDDLKLVSVVYKETNDLEA